MSKEQSHGQRAQLGCRIVMVFGALIVCFLALELILDLALFGEGKEGDEGVISLTHIPKTDEEFVAASVLFLREIGWWQDESYLFDVSRELNCSDSLTPSHHRFLAFEKGERTTLLLTNYHQAMLEFNEDGTELRFYLDSLGADFNRPKDEDRDLSLGEMQLDSDAALKLAEQHSGETLRESITNECKIFIDLSGGRDWEVDYLENDSGRRLMCFDIDPFTGDVKLIANRGYKSCEYHTSNLPP